jgi:hypothetical protein
LNYFGKVRVLKNLPEQLICSCSKRVYILPKGPFKDEGVVRDDRDVLSERMQAHFEGIMSSYKILTAIFWLDHPKEGQHDGRLARPCATHKGHLLTLLYLERNVLNDRLTPRKIHSRKISHLQNRTIRPYQVRISLLFCSFDFRVQTNGRVVRSSKWFFLLKILESNYPLGADEITIDLNDLPEGTWHELAHCDRI